MTVVCYRTKEPRYWNKGTRYETSCDHFLSHYSHKSPEETQKEVDEINRTHPERVCGCKVDWSEVKEFYVSDQEEMY